MMLKWYGTKATIKIRHANGDRIDRAARFLRDQIREKLSEEGTTSGPSAPGEYPRKQTGHLRRNIQSEYDATVRKARIGTNVLYGKFLELGTKFMARRPWLSRGLQESLKGIRQILQSGRSL